MNWVRKAFVGFLAFVLFVSLLWGVSAYNVQTKLSHPDKVETWLADSKIYDHVVSAALSKAQEESGKNGSSISVSYTNPEVVAAAQSAFSEDVLKSSANKFIEANYDWLSGKNSKPEFSIDLSKSKQDFANSVGKYVTDHLSSLAVCTPEQLAKLQIPVDPSSITCRPGSLDPKTEGARVTDEIATSGDLLEKPVITAETLSGDKNSPGKPYYEKLSKLPQLYQIGQKLAWIFALLAILCSAGIIFIHPDRRKGIRRVGTTLVISGILLIATKFVSDTLTNKLDDKVLSNSTKSQLEQPVTTFIHTVQSQLSQSNMLFGIIFVLIALAIFGSLFKTRENKQKSRKTNTPSRPPETPPLNKQEGRPQTPAASDISNRIRSPRPSGPPPLGGTTRPTTQPQPRQTPTQGTPQSRPPKPPRLIQ